jgi:hypothetical protein
MIDRFKLIFLFGATFFCRSLAYSQDSTTTIYLQIKIFIDPGHPIPTLSKGGPFKCVVRNDTAYQNNKSGFVFPFAIHGTDTIKISNRTWDSYFLYPFDGKNEVHIKLTVSPSLGPGSNVTSHVYQFALVNLVSSGERLDVLIDNESAGSTAVKKTVDPDETHTIIWKANNIKACELIEEHFCESCTSTYSCDPKTGKVVKK